MAVIGNHAPAFTVASLATTSTRRPLTVQKPITVPPAGQPPSASYMLPAHERAEFEERRARRRRGRRCARARSSCPGCARARWPWRRRPGRPRPPGLGGLRAARRSRRGGGWGRRWRGAGSRGRAWAAGAVSGKIAGRGSARGEGLGEDHAPAARVGVVSNVIRTRRGAWPARDAYLRRFSSPAMSFPVALLRGLLGIAVILGIAYAAVERPQGHSVAHGGRGPRGSSSSSRSSCSRRASAPRLFGAIGRGFTSSSASRRKARPSSLGGLARGVGRGSAGLHLRLSGAADDHLLRRPHERALPPGHPADDRARRGAS